MILGRSYGCSITACGDPRADLNEDGWIDDLDYLTLTEHWYEGERCRAFCRPTGGGGAGGSSAEEVATDLSGDGCIGWDELEVVAESYGCDASCAALHTDVTNDGCVDDDDVDVWVATASTPLWCAED